MIHVYLPEGTCVVQYVSVHTSTRVYKLVQHLY